jgi:hypothetical protein
MSTEMLTPKVTEIRRPLEAVTKDTFVATTWVPATTQTPRRV